MKNWLSGRNLSSQIAAFFCPKKVSLKSRKIRQQLSNLYFFGGLVMVENLLGIVKSNPLVFGIFIAVICIVAIISIVNARKEKKAQQKTLPAGDAKKI
jgi:hypothetical protein